MKIAHNEVLLFLFLIKCTAIYIYNIVYIDIEFIITITNYCYLNYY